jgi:hypothetical protein
MPLFLAIRRGAEFAHALRSRSMLGKTIHLRPDPERTNGAKMSPSRLSPGRSTPEQVDPSAVTNFSILTASAVAGRSS